MQVQGGGAATVGHSAMPHLGDRNYTGNGEGTSKPTPAAKALISVWSRSDPIFTSQHFCTVGLPFQLFLTHIFEDKCKPQ